MSSAENTSEAWTRLAADGLVEGDKPERAAAGSPWYVRTMLGIAGWIGALFLTLFIGAAFTFVMESAGAAIVLGAMFCGGAYFLFRQFDGSDFMEQFALVVSLLGQVMLVIGLAQALQPEKPEFYLILAAILAGLAAAVPNFLHRLLASCGAAVALALGINNAELHGMTAPLLCAALAWIWLDPAKWASGGRLWRPIGYGLALALLLVETFRLTGGAWLFGAAVAQPSWFGQYGPLIGRALTALVLGWVAFAIAQRQGSGAQSAVARVALAAAVAVGLISLGAPGLASSLIVLLLGFSAGNRLLMALGIFSLLGFVAHFYYSLHATLLEKSGLLALTGLLLLSAYALIRRLSPETRAPADA